MPVAVALLALVAAVPIRSGAQPVHIAAVRHLGDLPTFVATDHGLFAREGLEVGVARLPDGRQALDRLRSGEADFALMALTPFVLARLTAPQPKPGDQPTILASLVQSTRLNQIVTLGGSGIRRPGDLAGRRLGLTRGTNAEFHWELFTRFHGIDASAVEVVDLGKDALDTALTEGRIDAAVLWQPWTSRLRARDGPSARTLDGSGFYNAHWILVTRRGTAEARAALAVDVLRAYTRAVGIIHREPARALRAFHRGLGLDDSIPEPAGYPYGFQLHLDWSLFVGLRQQLDWAVASGRSDTRAPASVLDMVAPGPLRRAAPDAVNVAAELLDAEGAR